MIEAQLALSGIGFRNTTGGWINWCKEVMDFGALRATSIDVQVQAEDEIIGVLSQSMVRMWISFREEILLESCVRRVMIY